MRCGRERINLLYLGSKGEESTKDITIILSLSGTVNRSRGQQSRSRLGPGSTSLILSSLSEGAEYPGEVHWTLETRDYGAVTRPG